MDTSKLWFMLICVCGSWMLSLALDCDWTTQYDINNRCCKACPSGEYPKVPCSETNGESVCEKCSPTSTDDSNSNRCFCKESHLCRDDKCSSCIPRERCKAGTQLMRIGTFDYTFTCKQCPDGTYNDAEDSRCKSITKCEGVGESFPGNQTHNARCVSAEDTVNPKPDVPQNKSQSSHPFMVACLTVTVLTCLVVIIYTAFKIVKYKTLIKYACTCKLSKEEMGDTYHTKTEDLEDSVV